MSSLLIEKSESQGGRRHLIHSTAACRQRATVWRSAHEDQRRGSVLHNLVHRFIHRSSQGGEPEAVRSSKLCTASLQVMHRLVQKNRELYGKSLIQLDKKSDGSIQEINLSTENIMLVHTIIRVMHRLVHRTRSQERPRSLLHFSTCPQLSAGAGGDISTGRRSPRRRPAPQRRGSAADGSARAS